MKFSNLFASFKQMDLDELFAYETFKTVIVRDRRLGFLHYFFMVVIFIYIVYSIITNQLYLVKDPIIGGSIRSTAYPPSTLVNNYSYCSPACLFLGANEVADARDSSIFVSTRVSVTNATLQCPIKALPTEKRCMPVFEKSAAQLFYVAGIENYTLMLEHSVASFATNSAVQNSKLKGNLLNWKGELVRTYLPSTYKESDRADAVKELGEANVIIRDASVPGDILSVADLIQAAGIAHLDLPQTSRTVRYDGAVLIVLIKYSNRLSAIDDIKYHYQVGYIAGTEAKRVKNQYTPDNTALQEWNHHGLHIRFVQTGYTGKFDFMALLQSLVASVALLGVAKILVEQLMLRALKERQVYKSYKYEITEDFSDRDGKNNPNANVNTNLVSKKNASTLERNSIKETTTSAKENV